MRDLARYSASADTSRGRRHHELPPETRSEYQRDRDRIVHCGAFRRLEYKTQVFVNHEGDMFRTRLTHSLEVAQIGRTVARTLRLDEDLTEAVCLAHDLGHTPFGHAGQSALDLCMRAHGGFEHNLQSLRIVDSLEERYAAFPGLNLTFEAREGVLKHCSVDRAAKLGPVGQRFLCGEQPSLEAQLANLCDEVAYNHHDIDDGLRAGLLRLEELMEVEAFAEPLRTVRSLWPGLDERRTAYEVIRRMIDRAIRDLVAVTTARIEAHAVEDIAAVRACPVPLVGFSDTLHAELGVLKRFLHARMYRHYRVHRMAVKAQRVITDLFTAYSQDERLLPPQFLGRWQAQSTARTRARVVADYVAGMTDRYALTEHRRLYDPGALG
jgi:dGTPase